MEPTLKQLELPAPGDARVERTELDLSGAEQFEIGKSLLAHGLGGYEPEVFALLCAYVEQGAEVTQFFDIGANIGLFSLALPSLFGSRVEVTAFEPLPRLASFIEAAAARNRIRLTLHRYALSDRDGNGQFYVSRKSDTSNSLNARFRPHKEVIDVQVRTLDGLYADAAVRPYLVKIDTESTEPDVLAGARAFIDRHRPAIICEVLAGRTEDRLAEFFASVSYLPIHITSDPNWAGESTVAGDQTYRFRDWLFVPETPATGVRDRFKAWHAALTDDAA